MARARGPEQHAAPPPAEPGRGRHRTSAADGAETRAELVAVARELFATLGHAAVPTSEICARAAVTRGALYHHFPGKDDLFRAVCEEVAASVTERVVAASAGGSDAWSRVRTGCVAFLDASSDEEVRRILLTDAPSVLGWAAFREIDERHGLGLVRAGLTAAMEEGAVPPGPVDVLAHVLVAALDEAAMMIGRSPDGARARSEAVQAIERLLAGIAAPPVAGRGRQGQG